MCISMFLRETANERLVSKCVLKAMVSLDFINQERLTSMLLEFLCHGNWLTISVAVNEAFVSIQYTYVLLLLFAFGC